MLNEIKVLSFRAKIEPLLNTKSCQRGPGLAAIVINNLLGEDYGAAKEVDVQARNLVTCNLYVLHQWD